MMNAFVRPFAAVCMLSMFIGAAHAFDIPVNDGYVTDDAALLSDADETALETDLTTYARETSNEIAVVIVRNLSGSVASDVAVEIGRAWGVGSEKNNGILMLVSYEDRTIWIATGYGLEGAVPDIVAHGIAEYDMAPLFREGDFAGGIAAGIDALKKHIGGEYTAERYEEEDGIGFGWVLFLLFIGFDAIAAFLGRSKSWWLGGVFGLVAGCVLTALFSWWLSIPILFLLGLFFDWLVSVKGYAKNRRGGRGGGFGGPWTGGSSSGGGGFGGFGGGSFGGGGGGSKW